MPERAIGALVEAQEVERARIARELHDGVGQKLMVLQLNLRRLAASVSSQDHLAQVNALSHDIADIARELHGVAFDLHPLRLELLGVAKAIAALCSETSRHSGIDVGFSTDGDLPGQLTAAESLCLYRVAQEALHNVVKHSGAERASVTLVALPAAVGLTVTDNGSGFDTAAHSSGLGLMSIRERVALLDGVIELRSSTAGGTSVSARLPIRQHARTKSAPQRPSGGDTARAMRGVYARPRGCSVGRAVSEA